MFDVEIFGCRLVLCRWAQSCLWIRTGNGSRWGRCFVGWKGLVIFVVVLVALLPEVSAMVSSRFVCVFVQYENETIAWHCTRGGTRYVVSCCRWRRRVGAVIGLMVSFSKSFHWATLFRVCLLLLRPPDPPICPCSIFRFFSFIPTPNQGFFFDGVDTPRQRKAHHHQKKNNNCWLNWWCFASFFGVRWCQSHREVGWREGGLPNWISNMRFYFFRIDLFFVFSLVGHSCCVHVLDKPPKEFFCFNEENFSKRKKDKRAKVSKWRLMNRIQLKSHR